MVKEKRSSALNVRKKDRMKVIKTIVQTAIVLIVGFILFHTIFDVERYKEPDTTKWTGDKGFIALSYFGVGRSGTSKLVAKSQLDQQLQALYDQGYETISQQDILDFYTKGKALPNKALFLSFEDGRNDSSLFSQPLLEKYNFKATFLSYANKMGNSDRKFLQPKDMLKMEKTGFWELGSNGYRLTYLNMFDKEGRFIGMKDESQSIDRANLEYYNHYLMDFIRDENMIPVENRAEMETRINKDYKLMKDIYTDTLGYVPDVYMIMHANALNQGMNRLVSDANNTNIERVFKMNFNREGIVYNTMDESLYDLTRVQPAPYWYTNHLLMKINKDTGQTMTFIRGNEKDADKWQSLSGEAQYTENKVVLTSLPAAAGKLYLKASDASRDIKVSAKLAGNVIGKQMLYVRYDRAKDSFVRVTLENNELQVDQQKPGQAIERIFTRELDPVIWSAKDLAFDKASVYTKEQTASGAAADNEYPINIKNTRDLELIIQGDALQISVDKELLLDNLKIDNAIASGGIALASEYSEQNKKDDIYDAVFEDVRVAALGAEKDEEVVLFSNRVTGFQGVVSKVRKAINASVDWAIDTF